MAWEVFREEYRTLQLATVGDSSAAHAESRLDIAERVLSPRVLADVADPGALHRLQAQLLAGAESRFARRRSAHTVKSYMTTVLTAMNWAHLQGWLPSSPKIRKIRVGKLKKMKGRPLAPDEFEHMLAAVPDVVGSVVAESWRRVLRGLWESALRLDELMHVSWDNPAMIRPVWRKRSLPTLQIPSGLQKNATEDEIPLLPGFESLLLETPPAERRSWVFVPAGMGRKSQLAVPRRRLSTEWVGKVVSRIGRKAGVVVEPADDRIGKPAKYASAHDLRRSCAERLLEGGVPPLIVSRILRHTSWDTTRQHYAPGDVQRESEIIRGLLQAEVK
ncbi:MAG: site-specific integrase [Planctomycetota bacterium]|nr:MAG: site-specific integrase [Planctomycetota bacterium]REK40800.1 MAG: site-specific integrase [Planctomycetota bacterium]